MKTFEIIFLWAALINIPAKAEAPAKPLSTAPAATGAASPVTYELRDLRPTGFTQFMSTGEVIRQYFDFQNSQGAHHVIYEELPAVPPLRTIAGLKQAANSFDSACAMDIECSSKAFCTGDCKSMFYEVSNAAGDAIAPDRNRCKIVYFSCEKAETSPPQATPNPPPPLPAPAATPAASSRN